MSHPPEKTRLAPSPTGALHLGNARTFIINWALARQRGWRIALRIDDLDGPRIKPGADAQALETLAWLGLDWDEGPLRQSADLSPYIDAMNQLARRALGQDRRVVLERDRGRELNAPGELLRETLEESAHLPSLDEADHFAGVVVGFLHTLR